MADRATVGAFLFELQWWHGRKFVQRFHAFDGGKLTVWDQAWPLFELQQAYKALRALLAASVSEESR